MGANGRVLQPFLGRGDDARGDAFIVQIVTAGGALHFADGHFHRRLHVGEATGDTPHHPLQQRRGLPAGRDEQIQGSGVAGGDVGSETGRDDERAGPLAVGHQLARCLLVVLRLQVQTLHLGQDIEHCGRHLASVLVHHR